MTNQGAQDRLRRGWLARVLGGAILIVAAAVAAYLIANVVDLVRPGTLLRSRGTRPTALIAAVLIAIVGFWWSFVRRHAWTEMLASLVVIEVLVGALIVLFSASPALDSFFLDWFLGVNLYVGLPWLIAIGVSVILRRG
ncbi:MAG: hypothetical protein LAO77_03935 [Acidobacteriia bacterium]|nr:hypothetical protein [Terriglobia bacterium]